MTVRRNLQESLEELAGKMPVVAVTGPRQSGKTTLCRSTFPNHAYVSLEPLDRREYAISDPRGFLSEFGNGAILDEIQQAPDLLSYLQEEVDRDPQPGRFVLTGSQHFGMSEKISQSLAGRIGMLHLLPLSLDELARFGDLPDDLWKVVWMGAYPRIFDQDLDPSRWLADYSATYVERDVRQVLDVNNLEAFTTFLRLAAGRTAQEIHLSALSADAGISHPTIRSWLSVLETSFLCTRLPPWHRSQRKRVIKAAKLHFIDSGLGCHLLGITEPNQLRHHPLRGAIFESWLVSEVLKARLHTGKPQRMFHLRQNRGLEIDLLVEEGTRLTAVEVKSSATLSGHFFEALKKFASETVEPQPHLEIESRLVYGGGASSQRNGIEVIPWRRVQEHRWT